MKNIDYYLSLPYRLELIPDPSEGGYAAAYPELPGCLTCGDTVEAAVANAQAAKKEWLTAAIEDGLTIPEPETEQNFSGQFKLRMPKSLHKNLAEHSRREGISMNQYCIYLLSKNDALFNARK